MDTWIDAEELAYNVALRASPRRGRVLCQDGKVRSCRLGIPDTYFSIPAVLSYKGKTVSGYVTCDDGVFKFYSMGKHLKIFDKV